MTTSEISRSQTVASGRRSDLKRTASPGDKEDRQAAGEMGHERLLKFHFWLVQRQGWWCDVF